MTANIIASKQSTSLIKLFLTRVELSFWNLAITLLGKSRLLQTCVRVAYPVPSAGLGRSNARVIIWALTGWLGAVVLAVVGVSSVLYAEGTQTPGGGGAGSVSPVIAAPENGQRNLLIISVDEFDRAPQLQSAWLLMYFPGMSPVTLVPVQPAPSELAHEDNKQLSQRFDLTAAGKPTADFFQALAEQNIWWDGYMVIDEVARKTLSSALTAGTFQDPSADPEPLFAGILGNRSSLSDDLNHQTTALRQFCEQVSLNGSQADLMNALGSLRSHYRTDVNLIQLQIDWRSLIDTQPSVACEFPFSNSFGPEEAP